MAQTTFKPINQLLAHYRDWGCVVEELVAVNGEDVFPWTVFHRMYSVRD